MFQALIKVEAAHLRVAFTEPQRWSAFAVSRVCAPCLGAQKTKLSCPPPLNHNIVVCACVPCLGTLKQLEYCHNSPLAQPGSTGSQVAR